MTAAFNPPARFSAFVGGLVVLGLLACGCHRRSPWPAAENMTPEQARLRLVAEGQRRLRMGSTMKARMAGLKGLLARAEVDVIVDAPVRLYVSVRSFFEQPLAVLASDGVEFTLFDGSNPKGAAFFRGPVNGDLLQRFLGFSLWPQDAVALFLGTAPASGAQARELRIDLDTQTYEVLLVPNYGHPALVRARLKDDAMTQCTFFTREGNRLYQVDFDAFSTVNNVPLAHHLVFSKSNRDGEAEQAVHFELSQVELNGPPYPDEAFTVRLPPNQHWRPLARALVSSPEPAAESSGPIKAAPAPTSVP